MADTTPVLDPRSAADILTELMRRRPSYLPEWSAVSDGAGDALSRIVSRYAQVIIDRLNQAPDRNQLAFLDMLGVGLIPSQPARAPIVFKTIAGLSDSRAPVGSRVGANVPDVPSPVVFETENAIALAAARLTDVIALWPDRDGFADHSSDAAGHRAFSLFRPLTHVEHILYLAHDIVFKAAGDAAIEIAIELSTPGSTPISTMWEYWDGQAWQSFKAIDPADSGASQDGTGGLTRSGTITLRLGCGQPAETTVHGVKATWIRGRTADALPPDPARILPQVDRIRVRAVINQAAGKLEADAAYSGTTKLDVSRTFNPFGHLPLAGAIFVLSNREAFGKPGAKVSLRCSMAGPYASNGLSPVVAWEYWNGQRWQVIPGTTPNDFFSGASSVLYFTMPADAMPAEVNGVTAPWLRAHLVSGSYGTKKDISVGTPPQTITVVQTTPPAVQKAEIGYEWRSPWQYAQHCFTYNDFQFEVHTRDVRWPGNVFPPFRPVADATPAVYLGFDKPLPNDLVSMYLDLEESDAALPSLVWEAWDGATWRTLQAADQTASLTRSGMASFLVPAVLPRPQATVRSASGNLLVTSSALDAAAFQAGQLVLVIQDDKHEAVVITAVEDREMTLETPLEQSYTGGTVSLAPLPRFGTPRDWIRARLKENGAPAVVTVNGVHLNAVWATQTQTITNEVLGSGNGRPGETLFFSQFPILPGEEIEVRELDGARAEVELPILRDELLAAGFTDDDIRTVLEPRSGRKREVWVRWRPRPHLYFSGPTDRHYVIERARGRLIFGDGQNGRLPTAGIDNIRARVYRVAGGLAGNVPAGAINQMLGGAFAESVWNPRSAGGGADGESPEAVSRRGPETLRHRWRALAARDYEAMAREASPGVAAVRVLPATAPNRRPAPGWVTAIIVPQSHEPRPQPSLELRQLVHDYLAERAPSTLSAPRIAVIGPTYRSVGVAALIAPRVIGDAGAVADSVRAALAEFLHPLTGGPEGRGWQFGRDVFQSDVAAILEGLPGVDYVAQLDLLLDDAPMGTCVRIPTDQIVVAGSMRIDMLAPEV